MTQILSQLALGTLYYGQLSAVQFYDVLTSAVPELRNPSESWSEEAPPQTCSSPWSGICPPRSLTRGAATIPPPNIVSAVEAFCATAMTQEPVTEGSCDATAAATSEETTTTTPTGANAIPSNTPDGYYGYYEVKGRNEDDVLSELLADFGFAAQGDEQSARTKVTELLEERERLENDISNLETKVKDLEESIGDDGKFGPDGELHSLRDQCFEVEDGKYVYEVCLFGTAAQKDKGSTGRGTDLGKWKEATTETVSDDRHGEYTQRVWHWENGAKCWNGPKRSATAYVTCGAETKVLSADEPDTCRYVLQMESPVACDEEFRLCKGL